MAELYGFSSSATRIIELVKNCRTPFVLNTKPGDNVHIVTDTRQDPLIWTAIAAAAREQNCKVTISIMTPRPFHHDEPPRPIIEAMKKANMNVYNNTIPLGFEAGREVAKAQGGGRGCFLMDEVDAEMLTSPICSLTPDEARAMQSFGLEVAKRVIEGNEVHVTTDLGTDLKCKIRDPTTGKARCNIGPNKGNIYATWPAGECNTMPIKGTGEGTVVWDTSCAWPRGLLKEPIKLTVKAGRVVKIEGGAEAKQCEDYIKKHGDVTTYNCPTEVAMGLNPRAVPTGFMRTDKKVLGGIHIAMGMEALHTDGIIMNPTIVIDSKPLMIKGVFQVGGGRPF